ncbi:hypothetical protein JVT61DRAFT_12243 [Boletus reticuloceps]|uniref:Uncharacterized protein n=1 Tax=Boletus reticuloceps TaxID=495285 RepID=A0A8I2YED7_9AGAM|nr:hypothetical protein JVT61DRAFT_12243 [Boletus reticuloceps]
MSRADPTSWGPPSSLPRLTRPVTTAPPSASDLSDRSSTSSAMRGLLKRRHHPPSPPSSQTNSSQAPLPASSRGSTDMPPQRFVGSRLATSQWHAPSYTPGPPHQPSSRPSLELGGALEVTKWRWPHRFYNRRRSMSVEETPPSPTSGSASPIRPSSSLSNRPPVMEWLGPRTVKAFAAAGLVEGARPLADGGLLTLLDGRCTGEKKLEPYDSWLTPKHA